MATAKTEGEKNQSKSSEESNDPNPWNSRACKKNISLWISELKSWELPDDEAARDEFVVSTFADCWSVVNVVLNDVSNV